MSKPTLYNSVNIAKGVFDGTLRKPVLVTCHTTVHDLKKLSIKKLGLEPADYSVSLKLFEINNLIYI